MPLTVNRPPSPIQSIDVTCSVDPDSDSLTVKYEEGKFWFRANRKSLAGSTTDYVSVTLNPDTAAQFADALKTFAEQVD